MDGAEARELGVVVSAAWLLVVDGCLSTGGVAVWPDGADAAAAFGRGEAIVLVIVEGIVKKGRSHDE